MPRWASRINLEVTDMKIERLQDISDTDCHAEGTSQWFISHPQRVYDTFDPVNIKNFYAVLWDEINGKEYPWASDPLLYAYTFRMV